MLKHRSGDATPLRTCSESAVHKLLLDSYEDDGGLDNAAIFRDLCYQICSASLANSALLIQDREGCQPKMLDEKHQESVCHHVDDQRGPKENTSEELVIREPELLAAHHLSPGLRSRLHGGAEGLGFPESP